MFYYSFSLCIVTLLFFCHTFGSITQRRTVRQAGINTCTTPNGTSGNCVPVTQCPPMQDLLNRAPNHIFLKQSLCGTTGGNPKNVCCSVHGISKGSTTTIAPKDYSVCGRTSGGTIKYPGVRLAHLGGFPWHVALGYRRENDPSVIIWMCEGALISDRWIVTAGHCVSHTGNLRLTTARMGDLDLDDNVNDEASPIDVEVDDIIPHPHLVLDPLTNDIAVVRLKNPVIFNKHVRPVCMLNEELRKSDIFYDDRQLFFAGWTSILYPGQVGSLTILEESEGVVVDRDLCTQKYRQMTRSPIDMRSLCIERANIGGCQEVPGGPAVISNRKATLYLAGILSFHSGCTYDYPRVYTNVAYYSDWIGNVTRIKF